MENKLQQPIETEAEASPETEYGAQEAHEVVFNVKERNKIQLRIFEALGMDDEWMLEHQNEHMNNSRIFDECLRELTKKNPELLSRLDALRMRLASDEESEELSSVVEDLVEELREYSEFTEPEAGEAKKAT